VVPPQKKEVIPSNRLLPLFIARLGWLYLHVVGKTSRLHVRFHPAARALMDGGAPCIFAFWHRYQLLMAYEHRNRGVHVLVSRSKDGELIAQALHLFGFSTARGSSTRGGATAFMSLLEALRNGGRVAVTPDGPKGPLGTVHGGVLELARKSLAPVIPIAWQGTRVKALSSWDRLLIPLPFSRYEVLFDAPVPATVLSSDDAPDLLARALTAAEENVRNGGSNPAGPDPRS
jgi:lysophospholipid acyltransferase (LPLAT)-like uncharacterized protein